VAKESARGGSAFAEAARNLAWSGRALRSACSCLNLILTLLHLVAGVGNLLGPQSVRSARKWNRSFPVGRRQPYRVG